MAKTFSPFKYFFSLLTTFELFFGEDGERVEEEGKENETWHCKSFQFCFSKVLPIFAVTVLVFQRENLKFSNVAISGMIIINNIILFSYLIRILNFPCLVPVVENISWIPSQESIPLFSENHSWVGWILTVGSWNLGAGRRIPLKLHRKRWSSSH